MTGAEPPPDPQKQAADPKVSVWVTANAGTGKTTVLIDRVARLLLAEADPEEILCVTYTKAAAAEMQARLFKRLGDWSTADDESLMADLRQLGETALDDPETGARRLRRARSLFAQALETPGGLRIETIHAFCTRLLRRFPLEAGVPPGFRTVEDAESTELWREAIGQVSQLMLTEPEHPDARALDAYVELIGPSDPMGSLVALLKQHARVLASVTAAGGPEPFEQTLKGFLGAKCDRPDEVAARFLSKVPRDALRRLADEAPARLQTKLHAMLANLEQADPARVCEGFEAYAGLGFINFTKDPKPREQELLGKDRLARDPEVENRYRIGGKGKPQGSEITRIYPAWEEYKCTRAFQRSRTVLRAILVLGWRYRRLKTARAVLDFDDLVRAVRHLLATTSAAQWVLFKLDGGLSHILLDEAQDTSPDQWPLFKALAEEFFAGEGRAPSREPLKRTLFVVGDEKQSIYSFQGADPAVFLRQRQQFLIDERSDRISPTLARSYRTVPEVLAVVDRVLEHAPESARPPTAAGPPVEVDLPQHVSARRGHVGSVEVWSNLLPSRPDAGADQDDTNPDAPVDAIAPGDAKLELAREIALWVRNLIDSQTQVHERCSESETIGPVPRWRPRPVRPGDIMILTRKRDRLTGLIRSELMKQRVATAGADRVQLGSSLLVQDCLNILRFILAPHEDLTVAELLKGPFFNWSDEELFDLAHPRSEGESLWSALQGATSTIGQASAACLQQWLNLADRPAAEVLHWVLDQRFDRETGPFTVSAQRHGRGSEKAHVPRTGYARIYARFGEAARLLLSTLLNSAMAANPSGTSDIQRFVYLFDQERSDVKREPDRNLDAVQIMTVHGAKGLEAPVVILPQTTAGIQSEIKAKLLFTDDGLPVLGDNKSYLCAAQRLLMESDRAAAIAESSRLLYVALTRAQDHLLVCGHALKRNSKPDAAEDPLAWRGSVERALQSSDAREVSTPTGRPALRLGVRVRTSARETDQAQPILAKLPDWLDIAPSAERQPARLVAPSALIETSAPALAPFGADRQERLRRGRLIHRLVERLPQVDVSQREEVGRRLLSAEPELGREAGEEILGAALGVLNDPRFAAVFGPGSRAEAGILGSSPRLPRGMLINGRVDRLVILPDRIIVVDLKTDRPAPQRVEDVGASYLTQLAAYCAVLEAAYPGRKVEAGLLWSDGPAWMSVPDALLAAALQAVP